MVELKLLNVMLMVMRFCLLLFINLSDHKLSTVTGRRKEVNGQLGGIRVVGDFVNSV